MRRSLDLRLAPEETLRVEKRVLVDIKASKIILGTVNVHYLRVPIELVHILRDVYGIDWKDKRLGVRVRLVDDDEGKGVKLEYYFERGGRR